MKLVYVINGPNLNMLGKREPHIYGATTLDEIEANLRALAGELGVASQFFQSNHEGEIVQQLHRAFEDGAAVIINPAGFSYHSVPIYDAIKMVKEPVIEVHITNTHKRGGVYSHSIMSEVVTGVICGLGVRGYELALRTIAG
ncbi:type II 3-dehydroquinate dehydratase [Rhizobium leguminosarum]|uniref:type II 3-dehydroquinate dehydratase n=1 Tax=Rhizobium leguminosarum TaxID=384 RepID=UPI001C94A44B|nr:type II 3-dehydroquinate dehydratase [Rhizobium leguminosarum]MBY5406770.1 type II 3-dehydroquinate dehydratase [Rhizobium leguminosarum]